MPRGVDSPAQPFDERCRSVNMGLSSRSPGPEVDEGTQAEGASLSRGTDLESDGSCTYAPASGDPKTLALHEPMMIALLAQCAVATVHRATAAERTIVSQAHELASRGAAGTEARTARTELADAVAVRVVERLGEGTVGDVREASRQGRTLVTEASVLDDVALMERVARRLRRFVRGLVDRTVEVAPEPAPPRIDDPTRALARRLLARSGFVRGQP
jgi:hypothetical protein